MQTKKVWILRLLLILLAANLLLAACGDEIAVTGSKATPTPPTISVASLSVVDKYELAFADDEKLYLSPNGQTIAAYKDKSLCIYTVKGQKQNCATTTDILDQSSIRWSPDSSKLVMTEDFFRRAQEADIWLMEATTAKLTNLTEDNTRRTVIFTSDSDPDKPLLVDVVPVWSKDSQRILFERFTFKGGDDNFEASLLTIPVTGGSPTTLAAFMKEDRLARDSLAWSPDGKTIAFNYGVSDESKNGAYLINSDGSNSRRIVQTTNSTDSNDPTRQPPKTVSFSADGRYLLASYSAVLSTDVTQSPSNQRVKAVDGSGTLSKVDAAGLAYFATWSPTGASLAYLVQDYSPNSNSGLFLVEKPGAAGRIILEGAFLPTTGDRRNLDWAASNTILLYNIQNSKVLAIKLGTK